MTDHMPYPVKVFFTATNNSDPETYIRAFHKDAILLDAGHEWKGIDAIKVWSDKDVFAANVRYEIVNTVRSGDKIMVTAQVDGDYDKTNLPDPLLLDHHFTVRDDKISELVIELHSGVK